jgi:hypothetical protein
LEIARRSSVTQGSWQFAAIVLLVMTFAGSMAFFGLGNNAFWDDEANTALFGRNLLQTGNLTAFDGKNVIGYRLGAELDSNLVNVYMPPVQYYVAALGLKLVGATTVGGRIPFVLAGIAAIAALAVFARWHFKSSVPSWLPLLLLAANPAYLMFIRQCRYYAVVALLSVTILATLSHRKSILRAQVAATAIGVFAASVLMFTNYLAAVALAVVLPAFFALRRYRTRANLALVGCIYWVMLMAGAYVLTTANPLVVSASYKNTVIGLHRVALLLWWHIEGLPQFEFFPLATPVLLLILRFIFRSGPVSRLVGESLLFCGLLILYSMAIVAFSPQTVTGYTRLADMRYVVALMPIGAMATAGALTAAWHLSSTLGPILAVVSGSLILATNLFTSAFAGWQPLRSSLYQYLAENAHDYTTGNEAIVEYVRNLPPSSVIRVIPDYMAYPAMFYVPNQHYCCQLGDDFQAKVKRDAVLPSYVYFSKVLPDYILVGADIEPQQLLVQCAAAYGPGRYHLLPSFGKDFHDNSRPEIPWHSFGPPPNGQRGFTVLERVGTNPQ